VLAQLRQCIAERREIQVTLLNYRKNGQPFWNELKIAPVFSDEGDLLYFVGIQTDITNRKRAEDERDRFSHSPSICKVSWVSMAISNAEPSLGKKPSVTPTRNFKVNRFSILFILKIKQTPVLKWKSWLRAFPPSTSRIDIAVKMVGISGWHGQRFQLLRKA
jgi:hypothetical protein